MDFNATNSAELMKFLQNTLNTLDEAAGEVDEESHEKLAQLKAKLEQKIEPCPLLSEQSISNEIFRLENSLTELESKLEAADPLTKDLLGMSAKIFTKSEEKKS
eukprot:g477.t1